MFKGKSKSKVAIIGAGFVGSSAAYAMAISQVVSELVIIDVNREKAMGEAMDINHGLPFLGQMNIYAGDYSDCHDCDVIVVTAGLGRKPGETRLDLANKNVPIAKEITANIMKYYTQGVILVVSNPLDILTYMIQKWSGLPNGMVFGTGTSLDSSRFRYLLSKKFNVDVNNIHGYIIGEHGDTQFPAWSVTNIGGKKISDYCNDGSGVFNETDKPLITQEVITAGAQTIKYKGATYYAIAVVINSMVETILKNQNSIRTVSSILDGNYGVSDVALSLPSVIGANGVVRILDVALDETEEILLRYSADQIKEFLSQFKKYL